MVAAVDIELTSTLAKAVSDWRERWGLTHEDIKARGGPSSPTMTKIEQGSGTISPNTARKLETAFDWQPNTVRELAEDSADVELPGPRVRISSIRVSTEPSEAQGPTTSQILVDGMTAARNAVVHSDVRSAIPALIRLLKASRDPEHASDRELLVYSAETALTYLLEGDDLLRSKEGVDARTLLSLSAVDREDEERIEAEGATRDRLTADITRTLAKDGVIVTGLGAAGMDKSTRLAVLGGLDSAALGKILTLAAREGVIQTSWEAPGSPLDDLQVRNDDDDQHVP